MIISLKITLNVCIWEVEVILPLQIQGKSGRNLSWELKGRVRLTEETQDIISRNRKLLFNIITETAYRFLNYQECKLRGSIVIMSLVITAR